jgi:hypothetical protein
MCASTKTGVDSTKHLQSSGAAVVEIAGGLMSIQRTRIRLCDSTINYCQFSISMRSLED